MAPTGSKHARNRKIMIVELEQKQILNTIFGGLTAKLRNEFDVIELTTLASVVSHSTKSTVDATAAILISSMSRVMREQSLSAKLVGYVNAGGVVIFCDPHVGTLSAKKLNGYWKNVWDLPWRAGPYCQASVAINPIQSSRKLPSDFDLPALQLRSVPPDDQIYSMTAEARARPGNVLKSQNDTPVALSKLGKGSVGFVGGFDSSSSSTTLLLELCGFTMTEPVGSSSESFNVEQASSKPEVDPKSSATEPASPESEELPHECQTCHKPRKGDGMALKLCNKCHSIRYCSRECQKADWKRHKKECQSFQASGSDKREGRDGPKSKDSYTPRKEFEIDRPWHAIKNKTWLWGRSEETVYRLLIDAFRMRTEDEYVFHGDVDEDSLYCGEGVQPAIRGFRKFVQKLNRKRALLPPWWNPLKVEECVQFAIDRCHGETFTVVYHDFHDLGASIEKFDLQKYYSNPRMPLQLRYLTEAVLEPIFNDGPHGPEAQYQMLRMMMAMEDGDIGVESHDPNGVFLN